MARVSSLPQNLQDAIHADVLLANARRIASRKYQGQPNWVVAMEVFGLGSTYAFKLCHSLGIDPDAKRVR